MVGKNEPVQPPLNYDVVGATEPAEPNWSTRPQDGYRDFERTVRIGEGDAFWANASSALLRWGVKTNSGFTVDPQPAAAVQAGERYRITAHLGFFRVHEPVAVVAVVDAPDRRGFAYGTAHGHPVSGEEAFVLHREPDGSVHLTLRSLTRAPQGAGVWSSRPRCCFSRCTDVVRPGAHQVGERTDSVSASSARRLGRSTGR